MVRGARAAGGGATGAGESIGRSGASDPSFNLISEPIFILRKEGQNYLFASVIEPHGWFSEAHEQSRDARGRLTTVKVIGHDETGSVVEVEGANNLRWRIMVSNGPASSTAVHTMNLNGTSFSWTGNYRFEF